MSQLRRLSLIVLATLSFALASASTAQCFPEDPENYCLCGNGTCEPTEDRLSCPQDCPAGCNWDSVCESEFGEDASNCLDCVQTCPPLSCQGLCGSISNDCGETVNCGPCGSCGDGQCELGEDCTEDCGSSCVSVEPLLSTSATVAEVGQSITFTADPSRVLLDPPPQWDMGNGVHLVGAQVSYAYPSAGTFPVVLTASELGCGLTRLSQPVAVTITEPPCIPLLPQFTASATSATVGQSITFTADPSRVLADPAPQWDMGNGVHLTGSQVSYAYSSPGTFPVVLTASESACGQTRLSDALTVTIDEQPLQCDLEGIPPSAQRCCGDGTCQGGETPDDCSSDCQAWCGDQHCSVTQGEDVASCPADCCPSGTVCAAGCAPIPTFTISNTQPARFETVTLTADASQVQGSVVNWDFGDGHHCEGCPLSTTHRYEQQGSYPVRLTITESTCGSTKVSVPWTITVGPTAPEPWAQIVDSGLPSCIRPNDARSASIHVRNIGGTTWTTGNHDGLWIVEPPLSEPLFTPATVFVTEAVPPGAEYTFHFDLWTNTAPEGDYTIVYRMGNSSHGIYGDPASHRVTVSSACALPPVAPPTGDYTCHATIRHPGGGGVPGIPVELASFAIQGDQEVKVDSSLRETRPDGGIELALDRDPMRPATRVTCRFEVERPHVPVIDGSPEETKVDPVEVPVPTQLRLDRLVRPTFRRTITVRGRKDGMATARLFQSGPYDKPVVIPKPFDPGELTNERLTPARLAERFGPFLKAANAKGYDVWLTDTDTGQNIHEQAAEFAQIIDAAASIVGPDGRVIVAGYSLGGVTARLATARYQADPAWRKALGLRTQLPVSLIAFGDAPLRGAHISYDLQRALWEDVQHGAESKVNLNSCAAQQLLRSSYPTGDLNYRAFWEQGVPVRFIGTGVYCDARDGIFCHCDGGPAVFSLNGDGWAHGIPIVAFSDGHDGPQACYGGDDDIAGAKNVCEDLGVLAGGFPQFPYFPRIGDEMFRVQVPLGSDLWVDAYSEDLAPGSRLGSIKGIERGEFGFGGGVQLQVFSPTFIPFDSALPPGAPFQATWHATHNGIHGVGDIGNIIDLLREMDAVTVTGASAVSVRPVSGTGEAPLEVTFPSPDHAPQVPLALAIETEGPQLPPGYVHGEPARFYRLAVDMTGAAAPTWREPLQVCVDYPGTEFMDPARLALFHQEAAGWVDVTSDVDVEGRRVCGNVTATATFALLEPTNRPPVVHAGNDRMVEATSPEGAEVVLVPQGTHDPDEEPVTYEWRGTAGEVLAETASLQCVLPLGTHELTLSVRDSRDALASDGVIVTVTDAPPTLVSEYATGAWSVCSGTQGWGCTSEGSTGCSRPGTQARTVAAIAWTADPSQEVPEPPSIQSCIETAPGYVSAYESGSWGSCSGAVSWACTSASANGCTRPGTQNRTVTSVAWTADAAQQATPPLSTQACTQTAQGYVSGYSVGTWSGCSGTSSWTCTSATATGCSRAGTQTRTVTASSWSENSGQAQSAPAGSQACTQTAQGYIGSYSVGSWSACSSTCGAGNQTRSVSPNSYTASAPGMSAPDSVQSCTGESCTCDDMGWYGADEKSQCDSDCGQSCTKKQWCGSNECEPWPHYCWKC